MDDNVTRRLGSRLGLASMAILISSFLVCFGCLAFLSFLWMADTDNAVWRKIILTGWATRSITITSVILRWATTTQGITCTSMLAAVLLEIDAVPLPAAAAVSIIRFDNTGPLSLLRRFGVKWHLKPGSVSLLTALLSITTLALQFTSTALLSQVGLASLPVSNSMSQTYYSADPDGPSFRSQLGDSSTYLSTTPTGFPAFAEWISNSTTSNMTAQHGEFAPYSAPGIQDTGTVVRAFLPINSSAERNRLIEYHGFGTAVDTRVACMRPKLTNVVYSTDNGFRINGLADIDQSPPGLLQEENSGTNYTATFNCGFAAATKNYDTSTYGWPIALCKVVYWHARQGIYSVMEIQGQENLGDTYLVINATETEAVTSFDGSDVWESISLQSNDSTERVTLQLTLCMTVFEAQDLEIHAIRPVSITPEPALLWNTSTPSYNTKAVLRQLGAGTQSVSVVDRGIFDLTPRSWQWPSRPEYLDLTSGSFSTTFALQGVFDNVYGNFMNGAQYAVFAQMMGFTANPALAIQAFFTNLCAITYYDRIIMFDTAAPSSQVSLAQVTRPLGWTAYAIVMAVTISHLLLVSVVILLFSHAGKLSQIGSTWAAISQLLGPTTDDWIRATDMSKDKAVKSWLKARGLHETMVRIEDVGNRVQFVKKDKAS